MVKFSPPQIGDLWLWAHFHEFNGYGDFARHVFSELRNLTSVALQTDHSFYGQIKSLGWWDHVREPGMKAGACLSIQPTFSQMLNPQGSPSAMFTMSECDRLIPEWTNKMDNFDLIIVPNNENAMHYRDQTKAPIETVPLGVDFDNYHWKPFKKTGVFRFGTAGHLGHGSTRKGLFRVVEWFHDAFPRSVKNVRLSLKLHKGFDEIDTKNDPRIEKIQEHLSAEQLAAWHHSLDVYADGSTYEGWGLFPCNSLACGRPVIGVYYGGHREYFSFGNHIPIGYKVKLADELYQHTGGAWAVPNHSDGVEAMRWSYNNQSNIRKMGRRASQSVKHLTWTNCATNLLKVLHDRGILEKPGLLSMPS